MIYFLAIIVWLNTSFLIAFDNDDVNDDDFSTFQYQSELDISLNEIASLIQQQKYKEALVKANKLSKQNPHFFPLQEKLFEIYLKLGLEEKAENIYQQITNRFQNNSVDFLTAQLSFFKGNLDTASEYAQKVIQRDARNISAIVFLIQIYKEKKYFHLVEKYLGKIEDIDPLNREYLYEKILFLISQKYKASLKNISLKREIESLLKNYYQKYSRDFRYFYLKALFEFKKSKYEKSIQAIEKAIVLNPMPRYLQFKLEILFLSKKWQEFIFFLKYYRSYWLGKDIFYLEAIASFSQLREKLDKNYRDLSIEPKSDWQLVFSNKYENKTFFTTREQLQKNTLFPLQESIHQDYYEYNNLFYIFLLLENFPNNHRYRIQHADFLLNKMKFVENNPFIISSYFKKILQLAPLNFDVRKVYLEHLLSKEHYSEALNQISILKKIHHKQNNNKNPQNEKEIENHPLNEESYFYLQALEEKLLSKQRDAPLTKYQLNRSYMDSIHSEILLIKSQSDQELEYPFFPELFYEEIKRGLALDKKISLKTLGEKEFDNSLDTKKYQIYIVCHYLPLRVKGSKYDFSQSQKNIPFRKNYQENLALEIEIYKGDTQLLLEKFSITTSGENKILNAVKDIKKRVKKHLHFYGKIVHKAEQGIIIDWGSVDDITAESKFKYKNKVLSHSIIDEEFTLIEILDDTYLRECNLGDKVKILF